MKTLISFRYLFSLWLLSLPYCCPAKAAIPYPGWPDMDDPKPSSPYPAPTGVENLMFYIQRDPNANTVCYTLNLDKNGNLNSSEPLNIFWIRYTEGGHRKPLNFIQRTFAYGIKVKSRSPTLYEMRSVAYDKLPLYLKKDAQGKYGVYARIANKECLLQCIFVRIDGGTLFSPNVLYVELKGTEIATGKVIVERIKPS